MQTCGFQSTHLKWMPADILFNLMEKEDRSVLLRPSFHQQYCQNYSCHCFCCHFSPSGCLFIYSFISWLCVHNSDVTGEWRKKSGVPPTFVILRKKHGCTVKAYVNFARCAHQMCKNHSLSLKAGLLKFVCLLSRQMSSIRSKVCFVMKRT